MKSEQFAYCWRSGLIEFGDSVPKGALPIGSGDDAFRANVEAKARHAYDGKRLLVPGVPEAATSADAVLALRLFIKWAIRGEQLSRRDIQASRAALKRSFPGQRVCVVVDELPTIETNAAFKY